MEKILALTSSAQDWLISPGHPENKERILLMQDILFSHNISTKEPAPLSKEDLSKTHVVNCHPSSITADHLKAAGAVYEGFSAVLEGQVEKAIICARPPGHHAPRIIHGIRGFCSTNGDSIALEKILRENRGLRLAIIDTDAHHADGTEDIFFYNPDVLHISIHQDGRTIFPGSGFPETIGGPVNPGNIMNIPLPPGAGDSYLVGAIKKLVIPTIQKFQPDYIIHTLGFDGHISDPLSHLEYSSQVFADLTHLLNPHLTIIQGGYDLKKGIKEGFTETLKALMGENGIRQISEDKDIIHYLDRIASIMENQQNQPTKNNWIRQNRFFYDEEYIMENRQETYSFCSNCLGFPVIKSSCDKIMREEEITLILLHPDTCQECRDRAKEMQREKAYILNI